MSVADQNRKNST